MQLGIREYLELAPLDLLMNGTFLESLARNVFTLTDELWTGYKSVLFMEPNSRHARYVMAMAERTMDQHPELEPWRCPDAEQWAEQWQNMTKPDSEMKRLGARYEATIKQTIDDRIRHYQAEAASRLQIKPKSAQMQVVPAQPPDSSLSSAEELLSGAPGIGLCSLQTSMSKAKLPIEKIEVGFRFHICT